MSLPAGTGKVLSPGTSGKGDKHPRHPGLQFLTGRQITVSKQWHIREQITDGEKQGFHRQRSYIRQGAGVAWIQTEIALCARACFNRCTQT